MKTEKYSMNEKGAVKCNEENMEIDIVGNSNPLMLNYTWLRDNCRCHKCFNHVLNQREINILDIPEDIKPISVKINSDILYITWNYDQHMSEYSLEFLIKNLEIEVIPKPTLWYGDISENVTTIKEKDLNCETKLVDLVRSLFIYGVGFVEDVEPTLKATEKVVTSVFPIQRTFFGDMWEFSSKMEHYDSAYSNVQLGAHNDNTYFNDGAGLQVFHLLEHNGSGGETLLVDGFRAVEDVKKVNPIYVDSLKEVSIESIYIDPYRNISQFSPILHYWPNNQLKQIRFNLLDRSPRMPMPSDKVDLFYKSLRCLTSKIYDENGEWWVKLQPGIVAFINNWRILHGRANFTGYRKMGGCYVAMGELLSKGRMLKVIR